MNRIRQTLALVGVIAFTLPASYTASTEGETTNRNPNPVTVTGAEVLLKVFSGREDPTWQLSEKQTRIVFDMLSGLPEVAKPNQEGGLGYRGFRVVKTGTVKTRVLSRYPHGFEVYNGIVFDGVHYLRDRNRRIEQWLLSSGKSHLGKGVYMEVHKAIKERLK